MKNMKKTRVLGLLATIVVALIIGLTGCSKKETSVMIINKLNGMPSYDITGDLYKVKLHLYINDDLVETIDVDDKIPQGESKSYVIKDERIQKIKVSFKVVDINHYHTELYKKRFKTAYFTYLKENEVNEILINDKTQVTSYPE